MTEPRTTMQDIARMADVPLDQAIKVVLGQQDVPEAVRAKVYAVLQEVDSFHFATQTPTTQGTIGLVLPVESMTDDYNGMIAEGALEATRRNHYMLSINVQSPMREDSLIGLFTEGGADGIISVVPHNADKLLELCHQHGRPYLLVDYHIEDNVEGVLAIESKNYEGIMAVMQHLLELGHRRIGFITGRLHHGSARQRLAGYQDGLAAAGIAVDSALIAEGNWMHPGAYEQSKKLLRLDNPPTAIVASNDLMAFGVMQAASEVGLVIGDQLSITGFDDISMAAVVSPPLTTVRQPARKMGELAVEMMIKHLAGQSPPETHVRLDVELIIRASTGPAPSHPYTIRSEFR